MNTKIEFLVEFCDFVWNDLIEEDVIINECVLNYNWKDIDNDLIEKK